jgi:hypothetical protein
MTLELGATEVVQGSFDTQSATCALLILPEAHFLHLLEYEIEKKDATGVIAYLLAAWRRGNSKEIPLV